MARLRGYLHRIGAAETDQCDSGHAKETVEHFLFRCRLWNRHRPEMLDQTEIARGNLSFYLGGNGPTDSKEWAPNIDGVRATVKYAMAIGRLDTKMSESYSPNREDAVTPTR